MAKVVVTIKIMMESPDVDVIKVGEGVEQVMESMGVEVGKSEIEPVAFGLKCLKIIFVWDEQRGATDALEIKISEVDGVQSVEVIDVRRAIG